MSEKSKPENKSILENKVNKILDELCIENDSENLEEDIVALFEDIMKLFSGREEEFLSFEELTTDAKEAIYLEIKNIIALLKQIRGAKDKGAVMQMLSSNLINKCSKHSEKFQSIADQLSKQEQKKIKRRFADAILLELHRQRQKYIIQNKPAPKELTEEIEKYVGQIQQRINSSSSKDSYAKRISKNKKKSPEVKSRNF